MILSVLCRTSIGQAAENDGLSSDGGQQGGFPLAASSSSAAHQAVYSALISGLLQNQLSCLLAELELPPPGRAAGPAHAKGGRKRKSQTHRLAEEAQRQKVSSPAS